MTSKEFVLKIGDYFVRTKDSVMNVIAAYIKDIPEPQLDILFNGLIESVSPKTPIGISDIKLICEQKGIPLKKNAEYTPRTGVEVQCDCCGERFRYVQGANPMDYGHERCPRCRMPYHETYLKNEYEKLGIKSGFSNYHRILQAYKNPEQFLDEATKKRDTVLPSVQVYEVVV